VWKTISNVTVLFRCISSVSFTDCQKQKTAYEGEKKMGDYDVSMQQQRQAPTVVLMNHKFREVVPTWRPRTYSESFRYLFYCLKKFANVHEKDQYADTGIQ
jgi:hypothetical protein